MTDLLLKSAQRLKRIDQPQKEWTMTHSCPVHPRWENKEIPGYVGLENYPYRERGHEWFWRVDSDWKYSSTWQGLLETIFRHTHFGDGWRALDLKETQSSEPVCSSIRILEI